LHTASWERLQLTGLGCDDENWDGEVRRELMRINGIPDGGQQETTANTTKLVTDLIKSIDPDLNESDIIRSHRIGNPVPGKLCHYEFL
jgi:hypothetical protein